MRGLVPSPGHGSNKRPSIPSSALGLCVAVAIAGGVLSGCSSTSSTSKAASSDVVCNATSVAEKVLPSVVTITATGAGGGSTGSGEIIRQDGSILTNNHVVSPAANGGTLSVLLSDGRTYTASVTGRDPQTDLAVIKTNVGSALSPIAEGSSKTVRIGEPVVALGAPLGLSNSVTSGIVSALNRAVEVPSDNGKTATLLAAIQTDTAINPGNSGGALTNCAGELIGIPTANATVTTATGQTSTGNVGISFAIPVDLAQAVANELVEKGQVTHSYFGLTVTVIPPSAAKEAGTPEGLYVTSVVPGGPAANAGLQPGDVITSIEGHPATDPLQLALLTLKKQPGQTVAVTYERAGTTKETSITLGTAP